MKNKFLNIAMLFAVAGSLAFASCSKKNEQTIDRDPPTIAIVVNGSANIIIQQRTFDTVVFNFTATAAPEVTLKSVRMVRLNIITGDSLVMIDTTSGLGATFTKTINDQLLNLGTLANGDQLTYTFTVEDINGKTASAVITVNIKDIIRGGQFYLGGPNATINLYRFFGLDPTAYIGTQFVGAKKFKAGTDIIGDSSEYGIKSYSKIDILYFYNGAATVQNALYSADFAFAPGQGWNAEVSMWPSKNTTKLKFSVVVRSQITNAANNKIIHDLLDAEDFTTGGANDSVKEINSAVVGKDVIAFKTANYEGYILVISNDPTPIIGQIGLQTYYR